ncbi:hypothetical protein PAT01_32120 [Pseudoalteromonas atlantica]|uniref:Polysaccharide biosynthesis enzyme WcbI domain-containing protein n=1 Tax=Pseudoalteromonas atlantica TaxID=288 RepID=A0ABQ0UJE2_PSEAF|nr:MULTISPECIES: WcbI family polysaccharide biosynthesis putative acetyltransferase [unclassified Pseudoalteromonas]MCK8097405.1 WcbI family polysaccharide biosynthesis putative acetyltransferase [Pseudoalteromonas sp. 1CM17D]TMO07427.1 hypothetical protein CWB60_07980 [Pseudoalteromonas sp. S327]TMO13682.1 hypothetical protein CWB59_19315 [Pseudoalteromonas sp. S326]GEK77908.1 hypothetical protein PAT01_32120 [Pseudoalteromonas atlantica]
MAKKKVVVIANCQARAIDSILNELSDDIEVTKVGIVHILKSHQEEEFVSYFEEADFIIAQIVHHSYPCEFVRTDNLRSKYGDKVVSIVNLYYTGDTPYLSNLPKQYRLSEAPFSDYHFKVVFDSWFKGESVSEATSALKTQYLSKDNSVSSSSIEELKLREKYADIKISDFFQHKRTKRGFHTFNHPTNDVLVEYCTRILDYLEVDYNRNITIKGEFLDQTVPFIESDKHKTVNNGVEYYYTTLELVSLFFYFYNSLEGIAVGKIYVPKVIVQYWDGESIPPEIARLMDSWKEHNPDFTYQIYDYKAAYSFIQKNYGVVGAKVFAKAKLPAMQSDIFRVAYCLKEGGVYVDAATKCFSSIDSLIDNDCSLTVLRKWHGGIWNGFIAALPEDELLADIWRSIVSNVSQEKFNNVSQATGPTLFSEFCKGDNVCIIPQIEAKPTFDLINDLSHKGDTHWSKVQKSQSIYNTTKLDNKTHMNDSDKVLNYLQSLQDEVKDYMLQDLPRWIEIKNYKEKRAFQYFWENRQEFRSLIRYRAMTAQEKFKLTTNIVQQILKLVGNKPTLFVGNLYLSCKQIGPGLYIEHGFSTVVFAKSIGKNFWLNQNVTVGTGKGGHPTIGDNVRIGANSVVIGGIKVNDRVKVGAGAVLNFEVPEGSTVVAQKPRVIPDIL